ncbi:host attachment protein [Sphingomonas sp. ABOLG]|jgi:protein required for attachment to host cells|uniref:Host attachment protein n=1 Tax=Sphingomonas olei TaxID=1886787 RepID=A0ABY2QKV5_9SPHN|nr:MULTISPECIES: host attachment family protein [Sphingomonas]KKI17682.1 required for attachment to host cells family protein [Sphingomonas sp. Ag1]RSV18911.1 host attachment protein [Sphingomonas sp. ABOLG]THG40631.1 host attachment protein [Sphingomonas olei]
MHVPYNSVVLVADGRKLLFLRNEGDEVHPNLTVEHAEERPNPSDLDQKTDKAGRASSTQSGPGAPSIARNGSNHAQGAGAQFAPSRGSLGETDYHQLEEDRFAADAAELLKKRAFSNEYDSLIVIAPPKTLGELRKHYHKEVTDRLSGELAKDLTGHPIADIEKALLDA